VCINDDRLIITCDGNNPPEGFRSIYGEKGHLGLDLYAEEGQEIYCAQSGKVVWIDTNTYSGLDVRIESTIDGKKYTHIYEHLNGYTVAVGQEVVTGQVIGWAGKTGYASGVHLHFQVQDEQGNPLDPLPLMENACATEVLKTVNLLKYLKEQVAILTDMVAVYMRK